ncbi:MFS general substrate transporter, partial [Hyaloscypha hepaticicola]
VRKIDFRVLPPLAIMFAISIIDRINIGSARVLGMNKELELTGNRYNVCLLLFFPAYILAELPSNYFLVKFRPAIWLTFILFSWGAVLTGMGFTHNWRVLAFLRFVLGIFEGGMLPGMVYIISSWYCRFEVHRRIGWAYSVGVLSSAFAGVLSYALGLMGGIRHMAAWRWVYSASGTTMAVAIICYFWLASFPEESRFLKAEDKDLYIARLERDRGNSATEPITWKVLKETLSDWTTWMTWLLFTFTNSSTYALAFFVPSILTGMGYAGLKASLFSAWPYLPTIRLLWIGSYISDKTKMRIPIIIFQSILMIIGFIRINQVRYLGVFFATMGCQCNVPAQISLAQMNAIGSARRSIVAVVTVWGGASGGIIGSLIFRTQDALHYTSGLYTSISMASCIILGMLGWAPIITFVTSGLKKVL